MNLVWCRRDLRLHDQPALHRALKLGGPLAVVFILEEHPKDPWPLGAASRSWLDLSLREFQQSLKQIKLELSLLKGDPKILLPQLVKDHDIKKVFWNRRYEPFQIEVDSQIKEDLVRLDCQVESFNSHLLVEPWLCKNKAGEPYRVYTPFWKSAGSQLGPVPEQSLPPVKVQSRILPGSLPIDNLNLRSPLKWDQGFYKVFQPGEKGAQKALRHYLESSLSVYKDARDLPAVDQTSKLSPHLAWGELSVRQLWNAVLAKSKTPRSISHETYLKEIFWREFAYHLMYHFPQTTLKPLNKSFEKFPWRKDKKLFKLWSQGRTGVPLVDAGMRQLWATGWMHNRVRMVVGSFLVKNLMIPWLDGARWFWDTLVDADLASNTLGWQWVGGCGADAAPYFRVFNPTLQAQRFDPQGEYLARWVPELKPLSAKHRFEPWKFGQGPEPCLDLAQSRNMVLQTWSRFRSLPK